MQKSDKCYSSNRANKYIYVNYVDEHSFTAIEYWIELDEANYVIRQITVDKKTNIEISCKTNCLAENRIIIDELDGEIKFISAHDFNDKWTEVLKDYQNSWVKDKQRRKLGKTITGKIKYFYPQGVILQVGNAQGLCDYNECKQHVGNNLMYPDTIIKGEIIGYDDTNMWFIISNLKI